MVQHAFFGRTDFFDQPFQGGTHSGFVLTETVVEVAQMLRFPSLDGAEVFQLNSRRSARRRSVSASEVSRARPVQARPLP